MSSLVRTLQFTDDEPKDSARFVALPCPNRDCEPLLKKRILVANGSWTAVVPVSRYTFPISLVCHLLAGGPSCLAFSFDKDTPEAQHRFAAAHKRCIELNRALVLRPTADAGEPVREFLLAPLWGKHPTQGIIPVLGMYEAFHMAGDFLLTRVLAPRRLPVVFDLDETLIKARSLHSLQRDVDPKEIKKRQDGLMANPLLSLPEKLTAKEEIEKEIGKDGMVVVDLQSLQQYSERNEVNLPGEKRSAVRVNCHYYAAKGAPVTTVARPVLRLDADTLLTRIHPHKTDQDTSMMFRIRPHWLSVVRPLLAGDAPGAGGRPIVDAHVCTTAPDTAYAHEVWRVLDVGGRLIPPGDWPKRILAEVKGKFLSPALGLTTYSAAAVPAAVSPMPLAVILDDRVDVWEAAVRRQILEISKWEPYQEYARCLVRNTPWTSAPAVLDILRVGAVLAALHERMFKEIDGMQSLSAMRGRNELSTPLDLSNAPAAQASYDAALPSPPWAERLLPELQQSVQPLRVPVLPAPPQAAARQQWAAAPAAAAPQAPLDPRLAAPALARQASGVAVAAAKPRPAAVMPAALPAAAADLLKASWNIAGLGRSDSVPVSRAAEPQGTGASVANAALLKRKRADEANGSVDVSDDSAGQQQQPAKKTAAAAAAAAAEPVQEPPLTADHPVIKLSMLAQVQRKHLVYDCKPTANGSLLVQVKYGGVRKGFAACHSKAEGMRKAAEDTLEQLQREGGEAEGAPPPAAAVDAAPTPGGAPVVFHNALDFLKSLYPNPKKVIVKKLTDKTEPEQRYEVVVKRSGAPELVGEGKGRSDYQGKRAAAGEVLKRLGYTVTEFVPKHLQQG